MRIPEAIAIGLLVLVLAGPAVSGVGATATGASTQSDCAFPYETTDATGTDVRLPAEPEHVVTLNPSAAQTMWEIGAREKVVGLTKYASYLEGASARTNVSGSTDIVIVEEVVALEPDLVLAPNATDLETVEQLREANVTVYHFQEAEDIEDVYAKTRTVGRLTGACAGAEETVDEMEGRIDGVQEAVEGESRPDVLYAFFGYTAGNETFIHEIIETAGGNNVAADYDVAGYRQINSEVVVEADPDWIVRNSNDPVMPDGEPFDSTTAVREDQVVVVPVEHLNQPAPRIVHAITLLAEHFHPEAYGANDATETPARTTTTEPSSLATTAPSTGTETSGQSGLGVLSAVLAVAIALISARGRR